jgi:hypothetical protein
LRRTSVILLSLLAALSVMCQRRREADVRVADELTQVGTVLMGHYTWMWYIVCTGHVYNAGRKDGLNVHVMASMKCRGDSWGADSYVSSDLWPGDTVPFSVASGLVGGAPSNAPSDSEVDARVWATWDDSLIWR